MNNIKITIEDFIPSQGKKDFLDDIIAARTGYGDFESQLKIVRMNETLFYVRHEVFNYENRYSTTEDGDFVVNLPCIFRDGRMERKCASNLIFLPGSLMVVFTAKYSDCGDLDGGVIVNFCRNTLYDLVIKHSDLSKVKMVGNDLEYEGKKFYGEEVYVDDQNEIYSIACFINCEFEKYIDKFKADIVNEGVKPPVGLTDVIPELTQEYIVEKVYERAVEIFGGGSE